MNKEKIKTMQYSDFQLIRKNFEKVKEDLAWLDISQGELEDVIESFEDGLYDGTNEEFEGINEQSTMSVNYHRVEQEYFFLLEKEVKNIK